MAMRAFQEGELAKQGTMASEQEGANGGDGALPAGFGRERAKAAEADRIWWVAVVGLGEEATHAELLRGFHGGPAYKKREIREGEK